MSRAVTKSWTGTWGLGRGTWDVGLGDVGLGDAGTWGRKDVEREHARGLEDVGCRDWMTY